MAASCRHVDVHLKRGGGVFARDSRRAIAVHDLLAIRAVAQHRVGVAFGACHFILAKFNGVDFRVQDARVLDGLRELLFRFQDEHFGLAFLVLNVPDEKNYIS